MSRTEPSAFVDARLPTARQGLLRPGWPLTVLFLGFPLWWLAGLSHFVFIILAVPMLAELYRRRPILVPHGFGLWLLFLAWVAGGVFVLWAYAPGTVPGGGLGRLVPFAYRGLWYVAITVVALYVINLSEREMPTRRIVRLLGYMFVVTLSGGLLGLLAPNLDFPSLLELVLPIPNSGFVHALVHPSLTTESDFLGFVQARPTAPFAYANAWGNNLAMYLPFFLLAWLGRDAGWRRHVAPLVLALAIVPVAYSLNRGLWGGLAVAAVFFAVRLALSGRLLALQVLAGSVVVGGVLFAVSPLYDTVALRLQTPHSDDRRASTATEVITTTWTGSPLLGYGSNRQQLGNFTSIAGGEDPECHQCAAPPLGTQGFLWRLIFTTGFVGTALYLLFLGRQFFRHVVDDDPVAVLGCTAIVLSLVFFLVYDSLESPLYTLMIAIGLLNRRREPEASAPPVGAEST